MTVRGGFFFAVLWLGGGCSTELLIGTDRAAVSAGGVAGAASGVGGSAGAAAGAGGSGAGACEPAMCLGRTYRCGNCMDDDGDGDVDSDDVECTGPCDDDEDSFSLGIPGANNAPCRQDCFFDQDTGAGNDGCYASHTCDPLSLAPDYPPSGDARCAYDPSAAIPGTGASCDELGGSQAPICTEQCLPLAPNGCDCFGCCDLRGNGAFVFIGSAADGVPTCSEETLSDPASCRPCTPVPSCLNPCEACEACVGGRMSGETCDGGVMLCPTGMTACGEGLPRCPSGRYCITGCCVPEPR